MDTGNDRYLINRCWCVSGWGTGWLNKNCKPEIGERKKYLHRTCPVCIRHVAVCICYPKLDDVCFSCPLLPRWYLRTCIAIGDGGACACQRTRRTTRFINRLNE